MALRRTQSNIVNIGFLIQNENGKAGVEVSQAIVNGVSQGVGLRTINGARKSAMIALDRAAVADLAEALVEVLGSDFAESEV